ncbi:TerB family tellurite resistance protein [Shewanella sp. Isolate11]|uniref:tellurite resistance TerB family protein n=1 Tax=Shewanella sp. Isolate11 TaxID=2908530 RepID=UPI001EFE4F4C|nr:TerB family tellurite resistance protein [Shewanella sp. Isolate11]MCG9697431.1 TerB family tellurite resistance protein [Shewanella sp. Isolate11]
MDDILSLIKKAAKESKAFENHAAKELSLEGRLLYLQGLSLVMNADSEIHEEEKDYLLILIKSLDLDESIIDNCIEFSNEPDKSTIQSILKYFKRKPIAQLFLFDAFMMSYRDGVISTQEKKIIDELARQFEVAKGIYSDIFDLFCYIKNKNWQDCSLYFSAFFLNPKHFIHIFDYYDVNLDNVSKEIKETSKRKTLACIKGKIEDGISNEVLLPFLQSKIDRREASVKNGFYIVSELENLNLNTLGIDYNKLDETLYTDSLHLVKDSSVVNYFFDSIGITSVERYKLDGGSKKVISSKILNNKRVLSLSSKFDEGCLVDIEGTLWAYKKGRGYNNILGGKSITSNTKINFSQLADVKELQLHCSLTDKSSAGRLIKFYG